MDLEHQSTSEPRSPTDYIIRPAVESDLPEVFSLLEPFVQQRQVIRRTRAETATLLPTGFVAVHANKIVGFSSVEIYSQKLAEIQCLAVCSEHRSRGLGKTLVRRCIDLARQCGVMEVMAISNTDRFLQDIGFDYSLPNQKRALFYQLRSRDEIYDEIEQSDE